MGAKRNLACEIARGEVIAHWDDDDWMASDRLAVQVAALALRPEVELCGLATVRIFDPVLGLGWEYRYPPGGRPWVHGATMCYFRALWMRRSFPDLNEGEDTRFVWSLPASSVLALPDVGIYAGLVHPGNTSSKRTRGVRWKALPLDTIRDQLGTDWALYLSPGNAASSSRGARDAASAAPNLPIPS